jgi:hypothetical protein
MGNQGRCARLAGMRGVRHLDGCPATRPKGIDGMGTTRKQSYDALNDQLTGLNLTKVKVIETRLCAGSRWVGFSERPDGANPTKGVILELAGKVYGATTSGAAGSARCGVVLKLTR